MGFMDNLNLDFSDEQEEQIDLKVSRMRKRQAAAFIEAEYEKEEVEEI